MVKYDTIIKLDEKQGLKPGMSVAVEVFLARHKDVLTVPVAAVVEQGQEFMCWIETDGGIVRRSLKLGDTNDQFIVVEEGLAEGERVVLNPIDFVDEAQVNALKPIDEAELETSVANSPDGKRSLKKTSDADNKKLDSGDKEKSKTKSANLRTGAEIVKDIT